MSESHRRRSWRAKAYGFSLVELGVVIGVMAVLSLAVLVGRGFLASSRLSKMLEVIDTTSKGAQVYAGINGGKLPVVANLGQELSDRNLVSRRIMTGAPPGVVVNNYRVTAISRVSSERWSISIACTDGGSAAADCSTLAAAVSNSESLVSTALAGANVTFTFEL